MANLIADKLLATLKRHNPHKVRAYAGDDDFRDIAVPTRRKKWGQVIETIEGRSWTRLVLLDKAGAELGYVDNTEPARELEDIGTDSKASKLRHDAEWIVQLVIKAQRDTMTFRDAETTALLRAQGDVVREMSNAMKDLASIYREQREVAEESADIRAEAAAEAAANGDMLKQLMEAAPHILQMLPMLKQLLAPDAAQQPRPKNGA